jgi:hypothetical protein
MNQVKIGTYEFSKVFWNKIFLESSGWPEERTILFKIMRELETLVPKAQNPTGSIPPFTSYALYCLTRFLQPTNILEVGTYIGKSTLSMAYGLNKKGSIIHTCDFNNDIELPNPTRCKIVQWCGVSTDMFKYLRKEDTIKFNMVNIDGRVPAEDVDNFVSLLEEDTVICLDDFEGIEKGVINHKTFIDSDKFKNYALIYPPQESFIKELQFTGNCTMAVMIPQSLISFVRQ